MSIFFKQNPRAIFTALVLLMLTTITFAQHPQDEDGLGLYHSFDDLFEIPDLKPVFTPYHEIYLDSLKLDTAKVKIFRKPRRPRSTTPLPDTTSSPLLYGSNLVLDKKEINRHAYRDAGDVIRLLPGFFPRHADLFTQPNYAYSPGGGSRDLLVLYNNRPYNNPITDAANFSTFIVEDIYRMEMANSWDTNGPSTTGSTVSLIENDKYPIEAKSNLVYRQGFYAAGHADWRIRQKLSDSFAYHIGVDIGETGGRYENDEYITQTYQESDFTYLSLLHVGAIQRVEGIGDLYVNWNQSRNEYGRAFGRGTAGTHRNDFDMILSGGQKNGKSHREVGLWYVRNRSDYRYGNEDGNRLGTRFNYTNKLAEGNVLNLRTDIERTAAKLRRNLRGADSKGERLVAGITAENRLVLSSINVNSSIRSEYGRLEGNDDSLSTKGKMMFGGSMKLEYPTKGNYTIFGELVSSWRWPSMDESYGYWNDNSPDRWMDQLQIPQGSDYQGNGDLEPVKNTFMGAGIQRNDSTKYQLYLISGLRKWDNQISTVYLGNDLYSTKQTSSYTIFETKSYFWQRIFGPFSMASSLSYYRNLDNDVFTEDYVYGWGSLRYDDEFYNGQLNIKASVTARYIEDFANPLENAMILDALLRMRIMSFEVFWGTNNFNDEYYEYIHGYPNMHRDEIWGVRWLMIG